MALRVLLGLAALLAALPAPLQAQSFFDGFHRQGAPSPRPYPGGVRPYPGQGSPYGTYYLSPYAPLSPYQPGYRSFETDQPYERSGGTFRTLCVRMCDGYYFPISYTTPRSGFARDADTCSAGCGDEARLFYYPNPGGEIETMVDLTGMAYSELPNAFKYRKRLVQGCQCRPKPWSEAELQRHRAYAEQRTDSVAGKDASRPDAEPNMPASADPQAASSRVMGVDQQLRPPVADQRVIMRPAPIVRQAPEPSWPFGGGSPSGSSRSRYVWPGDRYGFPN